MTITYEVKQSMDLLEASKYKFLRHGRKMQNVPNSIDSTLHISPTSIQPVSAHAVILPGRSRTNYRGSEDIGQYLASHGNTSSGDPLGEVPDGGIHAEVLRESTSRE
ncbi:uncharacterized protein MELLADRAFT_107350 [Melampsora larici-populina 98AG31]|uniref:Uncharacterized protein n=1 Tax=Melampsora larici-populina (strain 98AG31 / pathotype 3-4-7) TaxID=747676 RepID=F4RPI0_MELLP|nr:uncharacterized protein MELLADRAFT_107350 [Melampsora larici-populina 98AG31]EGG05717.1 hypothetical protein MELLADRAFT_107350 [Melampsora larici-populina 98AG31]